MWILIHMIAGLQLFRGGGVLGTTLLPNLTLDIGGNNLQALGFFAANENPDGVQTLQDFVGGKGKLESRLLAYSAHK
jgi:hypothetical protein